MMLPKLGNRLPAFVVSVVPLERTIFPTRGSSTWEVLGAFSFPEWDVLARIRGDVWPLTQTEVHKAGAHAVSENAVP